MPYSVDELSSLAEIQQLQARYCRGIDRADADLVRSVYWEDAFDDHGKFRGTREEYVDWVIPVVRERFAGLQHTLGQSQIELDGDFARCETYFVQRSLRHDGDSYNATGRYLDRLERRNDEWRILERLTVMEWFSPATPTDAAAATAAAFASGRQDRTDPSYGSPRETLIKELASDQPV